MASDVISAARRRELEGQAWAEAMERRAVALADCNFTPMEPPPASGRCPRVSEHDWRSSCKSRGCPVCGPRWAANQRTKIAHNLEHYGGKVATIAITAPGVKVLPWACRKAHKHDGRKGCRVEARALREWCELLPWRWKKLRDRARIETLHLLERQGFEPVAPPILERVWEPQKRGAPHCHLVVPYGTFAERRRASIFRAQLERFAPEYGFGRVQGKLNPITGEDAARYLAGYLTGRTAKKSSIRDNIADPRMPRSLVWETPALSSTSETPRMMAARERLGLRLGTGITMRTLRRARHLFAVFAGRCDVYPRWRGLEEAVTVAAVFRELAPTRAGPVGDFAGALAYARTIDRSVGEWPRELDVVTHRFLLSEELSRELTELAFKATRPSDDSGRGAGETSAVAA